MTTTRRRRHTRRTVSGKRVKVRAHKVDARTTAANLWAASPLSRISAGHGLNLIKNGADRTNEGGTRAQRLTGGALMLTGLGEIALWTAGRTGATIGFTGLAVLFAGFSLLASGYAPPKKKPAPRKKPPVRSARAEFGPAPTTARRDYRYPDEEPRRPARGNNRVLDLDGPPGSN